MARRPGLTKQPTERARVAKHEGPPAPLAGAEDGDEGDEAAPNTTPGGTNPERGAATNDANVPPRESVSVNTLITRTDLGPNVHTFVAAGTLIPLGLEGYPRQPA
jgi:hypothetical protein